MDMTWKAALEGGKIRQACVEDLERQLLEEDLDLASMLRANVLARVAASRAADDKDTAERVLETIAAAERVLEERNRRGMRHES